jgi:hypothetical protein
VCVCVCTRARVRACQCCNALRERFYAFKTSLCNGTLVSGIEKVTVCLVVVSCIAVDVCHFLSYLDEL